jgi:hypothetical protein
LTKRKKGSVPPTIFLAAFTLLASLPAVRAGDDLPAVAIIIDDIGYRHRLDREAAALPGPLAISILPHSPHAAEIAALAEASGKEIMLHLPMEAERGTETGLGPGALTLGMDRVALMRTLNQGLRSVPSAIGVNNHMGSLLTRDARHMQWLMESLRLRNLFFVDSVTSDRSIAAEMAAREGVPNLRRDVFIDNDRDAGNLQAEFDELIRTARRRGSALAIGHPHAETLAFLRALLPDLKGHGVRLVSVSDLLRARNGHAPSHAAAGAGMQ